MFVQDSQASGATTNTHFVISRSGSNWSEARVLETTDLMHRPFR